jgi:hypothetical protein
MLLSSCKRSKDIPEQNAQLRDPHGNVTTVSWKTLRNIVFASNATRLTIPQKLPKEQNKAGHVNIALW